MYLFFDTETTGFPSYPTTDYNNWPRMVQLAWILTDDNGKDIEKHCNIVKPEGFSIPERVSKIHGITTEIAYNSGIPLDFILRNFLIGLNTANTLVAHNFSFDYGVIRSELQRLKIPDFLRGYQRYCTMRSKPIIDYCKILRGDQKPKWPKLTELYNLLFHCELQFAHNALADAEACAKCFFELKKIGII